MVRVKRKRDLDPVDTIVVEADETPAAKRRARDAALAAELDAVLDAGLPADPAARKMRVMRAVGTPPAARTLRRVRISPPTLTADDSAACR